MYQNYPNFVNYPNNFNNYSNNQNFNKYSNPNDERFIGGLAFPFLLGGVTG